MHMHRNSYFALSYKSIEKSSNDFYKIKGDGSCLLVHSTSIIQYLLYVRYIVKPQGHKNNG